MPRLLFLALLIAPLSAAAIPAATPIAFVGDAVPGVPGEAFSSNFGGSVNDSGRVAFSSNIPSGGQGIWIWDIASGGTPTPVLLPGPSPIGPIGAEIERAVTREITPSGLIGIEGTFRTGPGGVTSSTDAFLGSFATSTGHTLVVQEGGSAPGLPGYTLVLLPGDSIADWNGAGEVVQSIAAFAPPFSISSLLYHFDSSAGLTPLVLPGDPVPGDPTRVILGGGVIHAINEAGDIGFASSTAAALGETGDATLFGPDGAGGFRELIRVNGQAPGFPDGATVRFIPGGGSFSMNEVGDMAFTADLFVGGGGLTAADNSGLWVAEASGAIELRYREGDPVPGRPGLVFGPFAGDPEINASGDLAHAGSLALDVGGVTTSDNGVLLVPNGAGKLVVYARENDANPLLAGERWGGFDVLALGDDGGLIFQGNDNVTSRTRLYHRAPSGALTLLAGQDLDIDLGGGDVRTIQTLIDYRASSGAKRLVATLRFTDGSLGIVLVTAPAPICSDGLDNDGDGMSDWPADPGCGNASAGTESPQCQDGVDNDADGKIDFDGGASLNGGVAITVPDPTCAGDPMRTERQSACGLGAEVVLLLGLTLGLRRRVQARSVLPRGIRR
jgi:hypothetical protein